ncbi:MAG: ribokinase [Bacteroidota bacterium]
MPNILVIGSSNTDMILRVDHIPKPGETILGEEFLIASGGKGANQAVAAAKTGGQVTFITRLGTDLFGDRAMREFEALEMNTQYIGRDSEAASGVALIFVADSGENSIGVGLGANGKLTPAHIQSAAAAFEAADMVLIQLEIPMETVKAAVNLASDHQVPVILNPAPAQHLAADVLRQLFLLTPNESEAELLTGLPVNSIEDAKAAAQALLEQGVQQVVITLGKQGALLANSEEMEVIPGHEVEAVDTTAAGDVFNGALTVALTEGKSLREAIAFAHRAAAISVTRLGAQPSVPNREEVDTFPKMLQ